VTSLRLTPRFLKTISCRMSTGIFPVGRVIFESSGR
jgi:hypothetical protein